MSIDLTKCERYDYNLLLRPNGQTIVNATKISSAPVLKSQIINIPSRVATSNYKSKKFYFVFNSAQVGKADAINLFNNTSSNNLYLTIGGLNNDTYSNFYNLSDTTLEDTQSQEVQPAPLIFHIQPQPLKNLLGQTPFGTLTGTTGHINGIKTPIQDYGIVGKVFVKHATNPESLIGKPISDHCAPRISATPGLTDSEKVSVLGTTLSLVKASAIILTDALVDSSSESTLNGNITDVATDITVVDNDQLHAVVGSFIKIEDEIMRVTVVTGNTLTVERERDNTGGPAHADTTGVVLQISSFPDVGSFIRINNEVMMIKVANTSTFTIDVIRGQIQTTKAYHAINDDVVILINEQSYLETTVRAKYDTAQQKILIEDIANEDFELDGATINVVNDDQFSRTKEIGNPFGNSIKLGMFYTKLSMSQKGASTSTEYNLVPTHTGFYGAVSVNFSILCVKE